MLATEYMSTHYVRTHTHTQTHTHTHTHRHTHRHTDTHTQTHTHTHTQTHTRTLEFGRFLKYVPVLIKVRVRILVHIHLLPRFRQVHENVIERWWREGVRVRVRGAAIHISQTFAEGRVPRALRLQIFQMPNARRRAIGCIASGFDV